MRRVIVLNHFAAPRGAPGGTRHVELFGRLENWSALVVGARLNYFTRRRIDLDDDLFRSVPVVPYSGNGLVRIVNWLSYAVAALLVALRLPRPDVVYASSPHLLTGVSGWLAARIRKSIFVLEIRDLWPAVLTDMGHMSETSPVFRALQTLESFLYRRADAIVVMARGVEATLRDDHHVAPDKLIFIPNGADPSDFEPPAPRAELRVRYGLHGTVFAYTGAHGPANGLDLLLDAAASLQRSRTDVTFLLVGDGPSKASLVERAQREGLTNVSFFQPVPKEEMPALLGAVDVGVHVLADIPLFRYGVSPNKLYDYMAAGLPVITNTPGEVEALVLESRGGIAVRPDGLRGAIEEMIAATEAQRDAWGMAGRDYIARTRSRTALAARLQGALDDLVASRSH
jgi:glycosyltransferase involved in cell wall biosynthesis